MTKNVCLLTFRKAIAQRFPMGLMAILCLFFLGGCSKRPAQGGSRSKSDGGPAVPVTVAEVEQKATSVEISIFGAVEAYASVEVKAQITGVLDKVHFTEGQTVKKGDLLLSIDPREFQAALKLAQANVQKDEAQLRNAEKEAARQTELFNKGFTSQDEYDKSATLVETSRAAVSADKAAVENAVLQLDYCSIRSPIDGCIGSLHVNQGNLIKANDISVVTINQTDPIYVTFSVPEQYLPQIQKYREMNDLDVRAIQPYEKGEPAHGSLTFVDNAINSDTRTIRLRATFSNNDRRLWPGQYVNVTLTLTQEPNSIVIPTQSVQTSQNNQFVYVVKPDQTVEARPITVVRTMNSETVVEGVSPGETVVTDGQLRLVPGAKVQAKTPAQK